ncbi:hypothetical protein [Helicobacter bizzozeronii]|uniref:hypothetical protein n=1 Tax=Helicobacter bizzozeronii TaxID=56877 RepID=UPI000CEE5DA0|nr:hypothetical protein [Helicobacter bizzozeronii]
MSDKKSKWRKYLSITLLNLTLTLLFLGIFALLHGCSDKFHEMRKSQCACVALELGSVDA